MGHAVWVMQCGEMLCGSCSVRICCVGHAVLGNAVWVILCGSCNENVGKCCVGHAVCEMLCGSCSV